MKNLSGTSLLVGAVLATGATTLAMGQVANDECTGAIALTAGVPVQFDTTNATPSADPDPDPNGCAGTFLDWGTGNRDVWFSFTSGAAGLLDLTTCFAGGYDTSMVVYSGACGALVQVACNGDAPADAACQNFHSAITGITVGAGETLYIRVGGWNGTEAGIAQMTATFNEANGGCLGSADSCAVVHANPGCDDPNCCTAVCAANPLCCEIAWDQGCVDAAVATCGIFIYACNTPSGTVTNDCAPNATVLAGDSSAVLSNGTCNTDGPNHPAAQCNSGNDTFLNDAWWRVQAPANGTLRVNTCNNSTFDTKLAIYNMGTDPAAFDYDTLNQDGVLVGCNDAGNADCQVNTPFASDLSINVIQGNWYLIRVATYDVPGTCTVFIDVPEPCSPLPANNATEAEACGSATNNGCNATGEFETISIGSSVLGSFWADAGTRDTDFYRLDVPADTSVSISISSASFVTGLILGGDITVNPCAVQVWGSSNGNCPSTGEACLNPGTYYIFVAPAIFEGLPCGTGAANNYVLEVSGAAANCPDLSDAACIAPGPNNFSLNTDLNAGANGLVRCAAQPAFPACAGGGSGGNKYARSHPAGSIGGTISCVDFGVWSTVRGTNAAGTGCGLFLTDIPLPVTIGVYRDINGGDPTNKIVTPGDGGDLELIEERSVIVPGVAGLQTINFDPPLCVDAAAGDPIVITADFPDLINGQPGVPANAGYQLLAGGNLTDGTSATFIRLDCADGGAYQIAESLGATFTARWVVNVNGDFSGCGTPCPTDLNGDGATGPADLSILLNGWGTTSPDFNGDGTVGPADLSVLLNGWGACP
jgi:hypothetical protein